MFSGYFGARESVQLWLNLFHQKGFRFLSVHNYCLCSALTMIGYNGYMTLQRPNSATKNWDMSIRPYFTATFPLGRLWLAVSHSVWNCGTLDRPNRGQWTKSWKYLWTWSWAAAHVYAEIILIDITYKFASVQFVCVCMFVWVCFQENEKVCRNVESQKTSQEKQKFYQYNNNNNNN